MIWFELFESKPFMCVSSNDFAFRYQICELCNGLSKLWLVGSSEVRKAGSVMESEKGWDARYFEVSWSVSDYGSVHGSEYEIWILVGFGH